MEDMASLWSYQEMIEELKQKLLYTSVELEAVREQASEEMRKNKENVKQLVQLLKFVCQERDEAKDQVEKLLNNKAMSCATPTPEFFTTLPQLPPATKANSSITESNSLSDSYNYNSHSSSPVDSFFDAVSSPSELLSYVNVGASKFDQTANFVMDNLIKGKTLPRKGELLRAVREAGPLLQNLLVAGPLPRWRNPPPLQPFHIPPVSITGCNGEIETQEQKTIAIANSTRVAKSLNSQSYVEMCCGSVLNFSGANANSYIPNGKRQRFQ